MFNVMAQAFINAAVSSRNPIVMQIDKGMAKYSGKFKDGWSTKLSYRTYQKLKAEGFVS